MRRHVGANALLDLVVDGDRPTPVLISGIQIHKVTRQPIHVDLQRVLMSEELTVDVPIHGAGDSEAVDRHGGTIFHAVDHVKVRARADNLPQHVEADLTVLVAFDSVIHARDLQIPAGVALVTDPDDIVIRVLPPRVVEEEAVAAAPAEEAVGEAARCRGARGRVVAGLASARAPRAARGVRARRNGAFEATLRRSALRLGARCALARCATRVHQPAFGRRPVTRTMGARRTNASSGSAARRASSRSRTALCAAAGSASSSAAWSYSTIRARPPNRS